ncbi:YgaP family membrane protein (plasmid) [Haloarcula salina]|uniref:YgaP family membrane protein n=1 Tax=Haloarcula salina TaxID=1429914 RepID=UPI003C6FEF0B
MERNVGTLDRNVRIVLGVLAGLVGVLALAGYLAASALVAALAIAVGAILFVTGAAQRCPIYAGTGITTAEKRR